MNALAENDIQPTTQERIETAVNCLMGLLMHREGIGVVTAYNRVNREYIQHMIEFAEHFGIAMDLEFQNETARYFESQLIIQEWGYRN